MNKKGISPLIVTVLLIGFAIALAAIVMTWGTGFIKTQTEETGARTRQTISCATLNLAVKGYDCTTGKVTVSNDNDFDIVKLTVRKYGAAGSIEGTWESTGEIALPSLGVAEFGVGVGPTIKKIEIIPTLEGGVVCASTPISKTISCK